MRSEIECVVADMALATPRPDGLVSQVLVFEWREKLIAALASQPQAPAAAVPEPSQECYSGDGGDSWVDCPDDANFVDGLKVGDTYELLVSHYSVERTYVVTKVPDDTSDDYEVEPLAAAPAPEVSNG
jgi:hypothetical protein